jgi:hypothetical protein
MGYPFCVVVSRADAVFFPPLLLMPCFFCPGFFPKETVGAAEKFRILDVASGVGMDGFVGRVAIEDFKLVRVELEEFGQGKVGNG